MKAPNLALQRIADSLPPPKHKRSTDEVFSEPQRLHKVLASCGFGSRRAMEEMILAGRITVNRMPAEVGQKVGPGDEVRINGDVVRVRFAEPRPRILMYHKPAGELVTRDDPEGRPTVFANLPSIGAGRWINVGRLDYNTEGLLLFTNSGELANRLTHPRYEVEREYAVRIMGRLSDEQLQTLTTGVTLDDGPARCESVSDGGGDEDGANHWYRVVLKEGRNREVRRLFEALGTLVSRLIRTRFGAIAMPNTLKRGQFQELDAPKVDSIVASAGLRAAASRPSPAEERRAHGSGRNLPGGGGRASHKGGKAPRHAPRGARPPTGGAWQPDTHSPSSDAPGSPSPAHADSGGGALRHSPRVRPWKKHRRPATPAEAGGKHPPRDDSRRKPGRPQGQRQGPPRPRSNFDEVQPQSNANASPFVRATLAAPGGARRGYPGEGAPRQRSGPRAHKASQANGNARGPSGQGSFSDRGDPMPAEYNRPSRPVSQPQIRSKRTRSIVQADAAADARDFAASRGPRNLPDDEQS